MPGDVGASGRTLKCRKCRLELVRSPPHNIIQPSQLQFETPTPILCLGEEELPDWVNQAVEQVKLGGDLHISPLFAMGTALDIGLWLGPARPGWGKLDAHIVVQYCGAE